MIFTANTCYSDRITEIIILSQILKSELNLYVF